MVSADDQTGEWPAVVPPLAISNTFNSCVYLEGPGWTDEFVLQVAHGLAPWKCSVCGPGADPLAWMRPIYHIRIRSGPCSLIVPGTGGMAIGLGMVNKRPTDMWGRTKKPFLDYIYAYIRTANVIVACHEFGHLLGLGHRMEDGYFMSDGLLGARWHPDEVVGMPGYPGIMSLPTRNWRDFNHGTYIPASDRWNAMPAEFRERCRVVEYWPGLSLRDVQVAA